MSQLDPDSIVYADDAFAVIDKPSGLLVHRSEEAPDRDVLLQRTRRHFGRYVHAVHRLDRPASGMVVFAFSPESARGVQEALSAETARKEYRVLARGAPADSWSVDRSLKDDRGVAKEARTDFKVLERFWGCALVGARIHSGRRHQIRRHLNHSAHHVLGDTTYGKGRLNQVFRDLYGLHRLFLHAFRLEFEHPFTGEPLSFERELPADLVDVLARLRVAEPPTDN